MKYLLDSNTLIEAKNRYYRMGFCPAYWQWILAKNRSQDVSSITMIADELARGNDELKDWASGNKGMFLPVTDTLTQEAFGRIAAWVSVRSSEMKPGALQDFLSGADPWLIAKAMASGATVVTHESYNADAKKKFLIPNVCQQFNVPYMNTFDLLHTLNAQFVLPS
ncbi:DUF4411 family protein [Paraburkholderia caffeinilytica]|uniref:DUF4411 family protein n=1 Tax=Paraburkholderia caffeinilytica TaxID=1761016 RepID=UPI0038B89543